MHLVEYIDGKFFHFVYKLGDWICMLKEDGDFYTVNEYDSDLNFYDDLKVANYIINAKRMRIVSFSYEEVNIILENEGSYMKFSLSNVDYIVTRYYVSFEDFIWSNHLNYEYKHMDKLEYGASRMSTDMEYDSDVYLE